MNEHQTLSGGEALRQAIIDALREIETRLAGDEIAAIDVHRARRAAKRVRSLSRLAPTDLAALADNTRRTVRRMRRALGAAREADVRAATLATLAPKLGDAHGTLARLSDAEPHGERPTADHAALREEIAALIRDWSLCEATGGLDDIIEAARNIYRRMRKRAKTARGGDRAALHRWRTAVVDFEYAAGFLVRYAPEMERTRRDADRLRKHLGEINDLDDLLTHVAGGDGVHDERAALHRLEKVSAARCARLSERAFEQAARLLDDKPSKWMKKLRRSCAR
ncbi:MAG: CHAD domain-containing protein [Rhodoblastus sp.]|nr:CHAD domain-containing protein [Rhodoblastus sp.]